MTNTNQIDILIDELTDLIAHDGVPGSLMRTASHARQLAEEVVLATTPEGYAHYRAELLYALDAVVKATLKHADGDEELTQGLAGWVQDFCEDADEHLPETIHEFMVGDTYRVIRMYADDRRTKVMATGLTLTEAQAHCRDPETSSSTATNPAEAGRWFDGYELER